MSCHGHLPKSYCPSFYEILATIATNLHKEKSKRASHYVDITSMQSQLLHSEINVCSYPVSQIKKHDTLLLSITCPNIEIFKILSPSDSSKRNKTVVKDPTILNRIATLPSENVRKLPTM